MKAANIELMTKVSAVANWQQAEEMFLSAIQSFGFDCYVYAIAVSSRETCVSEFMRMSSLNADWEDYYSRNQLYKSDYLVDYCTKETRPILRSELYNRFRNGQIPSKFEQASFRARDFGTGVGVTIPLQMSGPGHAGISLVADPAMSDDECERNYRAHEKDILETIEALHTGLNYSLIATDHYRLSKRESEVLKWYAEGCREIEVAEKMGNSHHTVQNQLRSAVERLKAANKTHAVAKAIMLKLI